jgi:hypothetical protein
MNTKGKPRPLRRLAVAALILHPVLFTILSVVAFAGYINVVGQGGSFFIPPFESIQVPRLIAALAPCLILPVSFLITLCFYKMQHDRRAVLFPVCLLALTVALGQSYLRVEPDPVEWNYGALPGPAPGFLALTSASLPSGFQERQHHYSRHEYTIDFFQKTQSGTVYLSVVESDLAKFVEPNTPPLKQFSFKGQLGRVYGTNNLNGGEPSYCLDLYWFNGPKQRLSIGISETPPLHRYSPDDLLGILKSMQLQSH